ncbi:MFS general substrate transporter [Auriscalpium vulgare]|uniref:MFS general substrate transporter n=1 Tax=Auriscalpium vulgare TaxID=40419 RepID=A0ACB8RFN0_9AGAM|nr:MFS general substrate transporter [Auriscalpium vulgare]
MSSEISITGTLNNLDVPSTPYVRPVLGKAKKGILLALFCLAEFMDAFVASALFPAIVALEESLGIPANEVTWVFSAYSATFAAFLLISGRVADIYSANAYQRQYSYQWAFVVGSAIVGLFSLGCGFVHGKVALFILRALAGIGAALTVPSALSLIVEWFPEPDEQNRAIALFGGGAALGNVLGIVVGGVFIQWASWKWIFYFTCMLGVPVAIFAALFVPPSAPRAHKPSWKRLDLGGVTLITTSIVLFVYAVTTGAASGWGTARVIALLNVAVILGAGFFILEARLDPYIASLPPRTWRYKNVPILGAVAFVPFFWWCAMFLQLMPLFQNVYHWSAIMTAVRFLPTGVFGGGIAGPSGLFPKYVNPKWTILGGLVLDIIATILLALGDTREKYWSILFPAFIIGTMGTMVVYTNTNIALFMNTPPEIAGVTGAIFNSSAQLGIAVGLAVVTTISTSIDKKRVAAGKDVGYHGIADGFWFVLAVVAAEALAVVIWYKVDGQAVDDVEGAGNLSVKEKGDEPSKEVSVGPGNDQ